MMKHVKKKKIWMIYQSGNMAVKKKSWVNRSMIFPFKKPPFMSGIFQLAVCTKQQDIG